MECTYHLLVYVIIWHKISKTSHEVSHSYTIFKLCMLCITQDSWDKINIYRINKETYDKHLSCLNSIGKHNMCPRLTHTLTHTFTMQSSYDHKTYVIVWDIIQYVQELAITHSIWIIWLYDHKTYEIVWDINLYVQDMVITRGICIIWLYDHKTYVVVWDIIMYVQNMVSTQGICIIWLYDHKTNVIVWDIMW